MALVTASFAPISQSPAGTAPPFGTTSGSNAIAAANASQPTFPPYPPVCSQAQLPAGAISLDTPPQGTADCLADYVVPAGQHINSAVASRRLSIVPSSRSFTFPDQEYSSQPVTVTLTSSYPVCGAGSNGNCWYAGDFAQAGFLPWAPVMSPLIGSGGSCASGVYWTSSCTGKLVLGAVGPTSLAYLAHHWVMLWAKVEVESTAAEGYKTIENEYAETAVRVFLLCPRNSATSSQTGVRQAALSAAGGACPLDVTITVIGNNHAGLAIDDKVPRYGPVNFTSWETGAGLGEGTEVGQECWSGCSNVIIGVTYARTHRPVQGARVDASLYHEGYGPPSELSYGNEFLCVQSDQVPPPRCGAALDGLSTDKDGKMYLIYWAPGVAPGDIIKYWSTTLTAIATKKSEEGSNQKSITVPPYLIYEHTGELSAKEVELLIELAQEPNLFVVDEAADVYAEHLIEQALEWLKTAEKAAEAVAIQARLVVRGIITVAEMSKKYREQLGLVSRLLEAMDMPAIGLLDEPFESEVSLAPNPGFLGSILSGLGNVVLPGLEPLEGPTGLLWSDAGALSDQSKELPHIFAAQPETITVKVYEVSHCSQADPRCGPGYKDPACGVAHQYALYTGPACTGIQPELDMQFTGSDNFPGHPLGWSYNVLVPQYDPVAWTTTQPGVEGALP